MKIAHVLPVNVNENRRNNIREKLTPNLYSNTRLDIITYDDGPNDLEYYNYGHLATGLMIKDKDRLNAYDAISIACFYDPGVRVLRELLEIPVIGIAQASVLLAQVYGHRYGILVSRDKNLPQMKDNMRLYGFENKINSWKSLNMTVKDLQKNDKDKLLKVATKLAEEAIVQDKSEVIILGCGALSGLEEELYQRFNVPIINPIVAGIKFAETLASLSQTAQLTTSKAYDYESDSLDNAVLLGR